MKLAASNIAWCVEDDADIYTKLKKEGFSAIEIAPTRLVPEKPYLPENITLAKSIVADIKNQWDFSICSMQSLWYGVKEQIFGTKEERDFLLQYMNSALDFAAAIDCPHVVFGNPRNRVVMHPDQLSQGVDFFATCAEIAATKNVIIGMEANPAIYGTNYLNTTYEALTLVKEIASPFFRLNLDLGTILANQEDLQVVVDAMPYVSHVHISEPMLAAVEARLEHQRFVQLLVEGGYQGWISLEMKNTGRQALFTALETVAAFFAIEKN